MGIPLPAAAELARMAERLGFTVDAAELELFRGGMRGLLDAYAALDGLPEGLPPPRWPRLPGCVPSRGDNPFGAWARVTEIAGAADGPLAGRRGAIAEGICVAGVMLTQGAAGLEGYTPDIDATVVARILDAGGIVAGTSVSEDPFSTGGSHGAAHGPVDNPHRDGFASGGASCGSAALVGGGIVDFALGIDIGGGVRIPAASCGIVGLKPTFGLVSCTGVLGMDYALDHVGPMTRTVADNARLLAAIAGPDGLDSRQSGAPAGRYTADLHGGAQGLRIGVLNEAFDRPLSDDRTENAVLSAVAALQAAGATVVDMSVPLHAYGHAIWLPLATEGRLAGTVHGNGFGHGPKGLYLPSAMQLRGQARARAKLLPDTAQRVLLLGQYMAELYGGRYYGRAQNLLRVLTAAYDDALADVDALVCPTLPCPPPAVPDADPAAALGMMANACPFNATGHPALSLPCGWVDGLPVGLTMAGRHWSEPALYRAAAAFEAVLADANSEAARLRSLGQGP